MDKPDKLDIDIDKVHPNDLDDIKATNKRKDGSLNMDVPNAVSELYLIFHEEDNCFFDEVKRQLINEQRQLVYHCLKKIAISTLTILLMKRKMNKKKS